MLPRTYRRISARMDSLGAGKARPCSLARKELGGRLSREISEVGGCQRGKRKRGRGQGGRGRWRRGRRGWGDPVLRRFRPRRAGSDISSVRPERPSVDGKPARIISRPVATRPSLPEAVAVDSALDRRAGSDYPVVSCHGAAEEQTGPTAVGETRR